MPLRIFQPELPGAVSIAPISAMKATKIRVDNTKTAISHSGIFRFWSLELLGSGPCSGGDTMETIPPPTSIPDRPFNHEYATICSGAMSKRETEPPSLKWIETELLS